MAQTRLAQRGYAYILFLPALALLFGAFFYPLLQVVRTSFAEPQLGFGNYIEIITNKGLRRVFLTTFRIGFVTTLLSVCAGYIIAYAMAGSSGRRLKLIVACTIIPFWISVLVRAFAWMMLLRSGGVVNNLLQSLHIVSIPLDLLYNEFSVVLGMVHYMIPVATLTLYGQLKSIDPRLMLAARGLGAGSLYSFRRIYLPLSVPGIASASILIFISAIGFYIIPALLGGGKTLMIAEYISILINNTLNWGLGTAMATMLTLLTFLLIAILSRFIDLRRAFGQA